jgi:multiple sugar transport system ATP-binding protein
MTTITLEHLSKSFKLKDGRFIQAVNDLSFKLSEGGSMAIVGPSGCGKTTLLRMIAGLEKPDSGRVLYNDEPIDEMPQTERGIGMVFQNFALMPQWDAEHNISFFLRLRKREREVPERVKQVSKITGVGIEHLMDKFPRHLSGGEKQRVAIARAFARDLKLLLFDEPFANLDAKFRQDARLEARRLLTSFPVTTVYVTHDQQEASMMSDRILVMRDGQIIQVGNYQTLYEAPLNTFVAEFIGLPTINLFKGKVQSGLWHGANFGGFALPALVPDGTEVILGVRPQHIYLGGAIEARVQQVTPYYGEKVHLLDLIAGEESWQMQVELDNPIQKGELLHCQIDSAHLLFFDAKTGGRIS